MNLGVRRNILRLPASCQNRRRRLRRKCARRQCLLRSGLIRIFLSRRLNNAGSLICLFTGSRLLSVSGSLLHRRVLGRSGFRRTNHAYCRHDQNDRCEKCNETPLERCSPCD